MNKILRNTILKDYLEDYSLEMGLKEATVVSKRGTLNRFMNWFKDKSFNPENCREWVRWMNKKGLKPVSIKHEVRVIRATIRFLSKRGFIETDFALEVPYPKVPRKQLEIVSSVKAEEIIIAGTTPGKGDNCINKARKEECRQALRFIVRTGLRSRELIDLKGEDVNLENETFIVNSKSGNTDISLIPKDMLGELKKRVKNKRLFKVRPETLNKCLKRGSERLDVTTRVRVHTLRHIFCTDLLKNNMPMQEVSRLMRHSSVTITDSVYSHYLIEDLRLALNSKHPLIRNGLNAQEVFKMTEDVFRGTGIIEDERFEVSIDRNQKELKISVQHIN